MQPQALRQCPSVSFHFCIVGVGGVLLESEVERSNTDKVYFGVQVFAVRPRRYDLSSLRRHRRRSVRDPIQHYREVATWAANFVRAYVVDDGDARRNSYRHS